MDDDDELLKTFEELKKIYPKEIAGRTLAEMRADRGSALHNPDHDFASDLYMFTTLNRLAKERREREEGERVERLK